MRLTMVETSKFVVIDGVKAVNLSFPSKYENIHAIQWYDTWGEVEFKVDENGNKPENIKIKNLNDYLELANLHADWVTENQVDD